MKYVLLIRGGGKGVAHQLYLAVQTIPKPRKNPPHFITLKSAFLVKSVLCDFMHVTYTEN